MLAVQDKTANQRTTTKVMVESQYYYSQIAVQYSFFFSFRTEKKKNCVRREKNGIFFRVCWNRWITLVLICTFGCSEEAMNAVDPGV